MLPQSFKVHALAFELRITCAQTLQILSDLGLNNGKSQFSEVSSEEADAVRAYLKKMDIATSEKAAGAICSAEERTFQNPDHSHIAPVVAVPKAIVVKRQAEEAAGRQDCPSVIRETKVSKQEVATNQETIKDAKPIGPKATTIKHNGVITPMKPRPVEQSPGNTKSLNHYIQLLPGNPRVTDEIRQIWPDAFDGALKTLTAHLTEDKDSIHVIPEANRPNDFVISSPRVRIRCSPDFRNRNSLRIWKAEPNTLPRWRADTSRGIKLRFEWTCTESDAICGREELLAHVEARREGAADPAEFWNYWDEYLSREREKIDGVRKHPGWSYKSRRFGIGNGTIDFKVDDQQEELLKTCDSRILLQIPPTETTKESFVPFQLQSSVGPRWITAAPVGQPLPLDKIPVSGWLKPDWISLQVEYSRRRDALQQLNRGETAMPELNRLLPDGCRDEDLALPTFTPILDTSYNQEQIAAIQKALRPGTLTCVLGPPGTGKTSVIAEIASQLARGGGRVLISSQSNLAVDNALERVVDSDDVFRVRLGRPESVKLNPELALDRASERYRQQLLRKSINAFAEEERLLSELPQIPAREELDALGRQAVKHIEKRAEIDAQETKVSIADSALKKTSTLLRDAEEQLNRILNRSGLRPSQMETFTRVIGQVLQRGWQPEEIGARMSEIQTSLINRHVVKNLEKSFDTMRDLASQKSTLEKRVESLDKRIKDSRELEGTLAQTRASNQQIENRRRNSGFWGTLKSYLTDWIVPTEEMEQRITALNRPEAELEKPSATADLNQTSQALQSSEQTVLKLLNCLNRTPSLEIANGILLALKADVEKGELLERNSAFEYAGAFQSWKELKEASSLIATHTKAVTHDQKMLNEEQRILETIQLQYSEREVASCRLAFTEAATKLDVELPDLRSATTESVIEFSDRLRKAAESIHARRERWGSLRESLLQYHARLEGQGVDLKRAVIHEANVIAATCSGIAAAKDFDPVFDFVIIDEAGRATPLDLLIPMVRGKTIVLVGDYKQLPPMLDREISDDLATSEAAEVPLFERLFNNSASSRKQALFSQYRMVQDICDVVSDISYWPDQTLETCGIAKSRRHPFPGLKPIHWIQCGGRLNRAEKSGGHSLRNQGEILAAAAIAERMALQLNEIQPKRPYEVGIISMYRGQVAALEDALPSSVTDCPFMSIQLGTVDAFQGREKDAIILSFVATDPDLNYFFFDRRRLNVALSRAKELLVLIGGLDILGRRPKVFGKENPVARLRSLIEESLLVDGASKETFYAE